MILETVQDIKKYLHSRKTKKTGDKNDMSDLSYKIQMHQNSFPRLHPLFTYIE